MQIPNSSPQRRGGNDTPSQSANSQSTGGNQASGLGDIKVFKANDTVSIPPGGWFCDILMIGGGGGGYRSGAGAGACIVAITQTLPAGTYVVTVGKGGLQYTNGGDSSISVGGKIIYLAKGGGTGGDAFGNGADGGCGGGAGALAGKSTTIYNGGSAVATNIVNGVPSGPVVKNTYAVYGNSGGHQRDTNGTSPPTARYPSGYYAFPGGGGGIGDKGQDNEEGNPKAGNGGRGLDSATINGTTYNFQNHFYNGNDFGVDGFIGGGGGGDNGTSENTGAHGLTRDSSYSYSPPANTGSGGNGGYGTGSSGIVIIRVRT